ncbi:transcriptional regulator [Brevibacillus brevis]|uniref:transcriptional regulator n=1 Tax=Brevibacillus brevis TaxID=1393 RepID=UPI0037CA2DC7
MFGLGKPETKVKKMLKKHGKTQEWLCTAAPISKDTGTKVCADPDYIPVPKVAKKILVALRKLEPDVKHEELWPM